MWPDSHTRGHFGGGVEADPKLISQFRWDLPEKAELEGLSRGALFPLLEPGDAIAFGMYVIHGSHASRHPSEWRRSFINGYAWPSAIELGSAERPENAKLFPLPPSLEEVEAAEAAAAESGVATLSTARL